MGTAGPNEHSCVIAPWSTKLAGPSPARCEARRPGPVLGMLLSGSVTMQGIAPAAGRFHPAPRPFGG